MRQAYHLYTATESLPETAIINYEVREVTVMGVHSPFIGWLVPIEEENTDDRT